ncbi:rod shape-determining protein MreD [Peptostreptococcus canis]|uniref:Rod shape-determining protein MreD n=1 Tax=Peptostreptococcus canis TaxID=1159213 RepID=A0ABR6TLE8_9FIRM|nr:rod shape-determining protein MreD [Peptostreptococcus canis]MBC2576083.1 rod shape-determining protein MreD [Peptostreptococcus canis]MBP1997791.1 rod shape-determining protein MreD [Peptostreptococcus canis]
MKNFILFLIGILVIFIETFFTNYISVYVSVNLLLIYCIFISLYLDKSSALILVGIVGLMSDLISGGITGLTPLLFLVISYFIFNIEKSIFKDNRLIVSLLVFVISIVYSIINAVVSAIFFVPTPLVVAFFKAIFLIPIVNTMIAFILFTLFQDKLINLREE